MRKVSTGKPCAGEPHARFGGRGGKTSLPLSTKFFIIPLKKRDIIYSFALTYSYDEFFYHTVDSEHIVYGYKEGVFFEKKYEAEDDLENLIQQL